ncbi:MAG TPA: polysaccharide deacetylase family protein [Syntrophomonas sp.]|nr:polysaccharide deacetylase family protein [Syntrophomonas sp.]
MKPWFKSAVWLLIALLLLVMVKFQLGSLQTFAKEDSEISRIIYVADSNLSQRLITRVNTGGDKLVALTFDDGPDPRYTNQVLRILKQYNVKATFFVVGENAAAHPDLIRQEVRDGHEIENHTYTHADLSHASETGTKNEIQKADALLKEMLQRGIKYFRPPKKLFRTETIDIAEECGYKTILWTICVENSSAPTPREMAQRVIDAARPGMIILAHDGRMDRSRTIQALPFIIAAYQKQGYRFVTLDELIKAESTERK